MSDHECHLASETPPPSLLPVAPTPGSKTLRHQVAKVLHAVEPGGYHRGAAAVCPPCQERTDAVMALVQPALVVKDATGAPYCERHDVWHASGPENSCEVWDEAIARIAEDERLRKVNADAGKLIARLKQEVGVQDVQIAELRARLAELENALNWQTSCTGCAGYLDASIREYERADKAEAAIARVHEVHYPITYADKQYCAACSYIGGVPLMPYPCPTIRALAEPEGAQP